MGGIRSRRLGRIADVFIVLPACAQVTSWKESGEEDEREPEKERAALAPGGNQRAGTVLLEFLFLLARSPVAVVVDIVVCSRSEKASRSFASRQVLRI